ncbi:autotransporter assembly complex protein TamB [Pasteurella bettyae]|uniref:PF04357 family protein n=1 Tax=Pasteurella bettyae CCUG 2042 TaxID=1095749 RepID=I3D8T4_9PAST|nr:translocation/assembly module TamB domain-containing protein [Pasteurella bettyae]EIJ68127.1 PF04357 family protein [Pasteurella bettyae CCUG 2042]SUB22581.1 Family of uncharacterised function (DUF490) [Pasteurella bettyae]
MTENIENTTTVEPPPPEKTPTNKKKWCYRIFCIVSLIILVPIIGVIGALSNQSGQQELLKLTDKMMDNLSFEQITGNLQEGLELHNVRFQSPGIDTLVEKAHIKLDFSCLWHREVCVEDISIQKPIINIDTSLLPPSEDEPEKESEPMKRIHLPISISVKNVAVDELALGIDANQLILEHFKTAASLDNEKGLILFPTEINDFSFVAKTTKTELEKAEKQMAEEAKQVQPVDWAKIEEMLTPPLLGDVMQVILPFDMHIEDIQGNNWKYESFIEDKSQQVITVPHMQLQADATDYHVQLKTLNLNSNLGNLTGSGELQLNENFPLDITIHTDINQMKQGKVILLPDSQLELKLSGNLKKQTALSLTTSGAIEAILTGKVELNEEKTPFNLQLIGKKAQYPFSLADGSMPLQLQDINLNVSGNLLDYKGQLSAQVEGMGIPKTQVDFDGQGKLYEATIERLQFLTLDGSLNLVGHINWKQGVEWKTDAVLNKINMGGYIKDFPAILSGNISSSGLANNQTWKVEIPTLDVKGTVSQRPLSLKGNLTASQETLLNIPDLLLTYGDNKISAKGILSDKSDFNLDINAPNLKGLVPDLSASVNGRMVLTGNIAEPHLDLDLKGNQIQYQNFHLGKFYAQGKVNSESQIEGNLNIALEGFNYGDIKLNDATLTAQGDEKNHQLHLRSHGEPVAAQLNLTGSFDRSTQVWKGAISQTDIKSPIGNITNNQFTVNYDNKESKTTISSHCWHNPSIELCFPENLVVGSTGEIPFEIKKVDLALVNKLTEKENLLSGQLNSKGKVAWFTDKPMKLDAEIKSDGIKFAQKIEGREFKLGVSKLNLTANMENNNLAVKSVISLQNQGNLNADLKLQDLSKSRKLSGSLKIAGLNLNLANQLLANTEHISGDVGANLTFAGDLNSPLINGNFDVKNMKAAMRALPFDLTGGDLTLRFNGNHSVLRGNLQTSESRLEVDGDASWKDLDHWTARVHAKGNEFKLDIPTMAKLKVSPNVEMKASPKLLELTGNVDIPWGRIIVESLPEHAVSVSKDEIILDDTKPRTRVVQFPAEAEGMAIKSDLKINVGDDVFLDAYGLKTELVGNLMVKQEKGKLGLYGQIDLKKGRYASFGQDLLIRKGYISFNGLPSQPMLNIEAIRNPEAMEDSNITAGVNVTGLADTPTVQVFSEPGLPQDQALSYLLTGRSLENSGEAGSSGSVGAALLGIGLAKSGKLVGGIGEAFGIQDLNLGTSGVGDSSKVVVSGNITPRLQLKYGVGLFDGLAEFTLRYRLCPQLYLQSVSGVNQAVDILYQFEF